MKWASLIRWPRPSKQPAAVADPPAGAPDPATARRAAGSARAPVALRPIVETGSLALYHWLPGSNAGLRNFGDDISPLIVARLLARHGRPDVDVVQAEKGRAKLLAVGSVLQYARDGDVVWGSGINGKSWPRLLTAETRLDVRSVRGPLTEEALVRSGIACPSIHGDPGLLVPELFAGEIAARAKAVKSIPSAAVVYMPNLNDERFGNEDAARRDRRVHYVSPSDDPFRVAAIISQAALVIGSSLHALVFADALGVPCRPVLSRFEPLFKYLDYFEGTGRTNVRFSHDIDEALLARDLPPPRLDRKAVLDAFPSDLVIGDALSRRSVQDLPASTSG